jgi:hypothetical protein
MTNISESMDIEIPPLPACYTYNSPEHKPPFNTDYCEINITNIVYLQNKSSEFISECMRLTIGKEGSNFKKITEKNKIAFIYHNIETNSISIWGNKNKFKNVQREIMNHIQWASNYLKIKNN